MTSGPHRSPVAALRAYALRALACVPPCLLAWPASAAESAAALPDTGTGMLRALGGLAAVLATFAAFAWLMRRFAPGGMKRQGHLLRTVAALSVGQKENVVVVEIGEQWLVLGVAPGRVQMLSQVPRQETAAAQPAALSAAFSTPPIVHSFAQLLKRHRHET